MNPWPQGNSLLEVHGTAADDVWASGAHGTILHWDGAAWTLTPSGLSERIVGIYAARRGEAWAVSVDSAGRVLRWNGAAWSQAVDTSPFLPFSIWGFGPTQIVAAGREAGDMKFMRFDGGTWSAPVSTSQFGYLEGLWGVAPNLMFGAGPSGVYRWGGSGAYWGNDISQPAMKEISGTGVGDVWAAGAQQLWHHDGVTWTGAGAVSNNHFWSALWASARNDVWLFGRKGTSPGGYPIYHFNGAWSEYDAGFQLQNSPNAAWGANPSDVWAVGKSGTLLHYDGGSWAHFSRGTEEPDFTSVLVTAPNEAWVFDDTHRVRRWTSAGVSVIELGDRTVRLAVAASAAPDDMWAGSPKATAAIMHWDGRGWTSAGPALWGVNAVHGTSRYRYAIAGSAGTLWRYDEGGWHMERLGLGTWQGVFVAPGGDAWAVGAGGALAQLVRRVGERAQPDRRLSRRSVGRRR